MLQLGIKNYCANDDEEEVFKAPEPKTAQKAPLPILKLDVSCADTIEEESKSVSVSAHKQMHEVFCFDICSPSNSMNVHYDFYHKFNQFYDISMRKCGREFQQDRYSVIFPLKKGTQDSFYGIYDGHTTETIASILRHKLHTMITENAKYDENIELAIQESFYRMDQEITTYLKQNQLKGGSTALCALFKKKNLYIINLGDSQAAIINSNYNIKFLNNLHRPGQEQELNRLRKKEAVLLERHSLLYINGEIGVSRSFGDAEYKDFISSEPEITHLEINPLDRYLLMGTDGFWETIQIDELPKLIEDWDRQQMEVLRVEKLSDMLMNLASQRNTSYKQDNMTLMVIDLKKLEEIYTNGFEKIISEQNCTSSNSDSNDELGHNSNEENQYLEENNYIVKPNTKKIKKSNAPQFDFACQNDSSGDEKQNSEDKENQDQINNGYFKNEEAMTELAENLSSCKKKPGNSSAFAFDF